MGQDLFELPEKKRQDLWSVILNYAFATWKLDYYNELHEVARKNHSETSGGVEHGSLPSDSRV